MLIYLQVFWYGLDIFLSLSSKSWHNSIYYHIILYDSSVFLGSGFHNPSYSKSSYFKFLTSKFQNISTGNFKTSWSSCYSSYWFRNLGASPHPVVWPLKKQYFFSSLSYSKMLTNLHYKGSLNALIWQHYTFYTQCLSSPSLQLTEPFSKEKKKYND